MSHRKGVYVFWSRRFKISLKTWRHILSLLLVEWIMNKWMDMFYNVVCLLREAFLRHLAVNRPMSFCNTLVLIEAVNSSIWQFYIRFDTMQLLSSSNELSHTKEDSKSNTLYWKKVLLEHILLQVLSVLMLNNASHIYIMSQSYWLNDARHIYYKLHCKILKC